MTVGAMLLVAITASVALACGLVALVIVALNDREFRRRISALERDMWPLQ